MSLPREIRDQIYSYLVVLAHPIPFLSLLGPTIDDSEILWQIGLLSSWTSLPCPTIEACQVFYRQNTFQLHIDKLPDFLHRNVHDWFIHQNYDETICRVDQPSLTHEFDVKSNICKLTIFMKEWTGPAVQSMTGDLRTLLDCPQLQRVKFKLAQLTWQGLRSECEDVLRKVHQHIGDGLEFHVEGRSGNGKLEFHR